MNPNELISALPLLNVREKISGKVCVNKVKESENYVG